MTAPSAPSNVLYMNTTSTAAATVTFEGQTFGVIRKATKFVSF